MFSPPSFLSLQQHKAVSSKGVFLFDFTLAVPHQPSCPMIDSSQDILCLRPILRTVRSFDQNVNPHAKSERDYKPSAVLCPDGFEVFRIVDAQFLKLVFSKKLPEEIPLPAMWMPRTFTPKTQQDRQELESSSSRLVTQIKRSDFWGGRAFYTVADEGKGGMIVTETKWKGGLRELRRMGEDGAEKVYTLYIPLQWHKELWTVRPGAIENHIVKRQWGVCGRSANQENAARPVYENAVMIFKFPTISVCQHSHFPTRLDFEWMVSHIVYFYDEKCRALENNK